MIDSNREGVSFLKKRLNITGRENLEDRKACVKSIDIQSLTLMEELVLIGLKDKKGYIPLLNSSISYVLRGCIILELYFRGRITTGGHDISKTPRIHNITGYEAYNSSEKIVKIVNYNKTGDTILDETLRIISAEEHTISGWVDILSGETWNPINGSLKLKSVRERVSKGLVDKGILSTHKKSFLYIFDMATHPLLDYKVKGGIASRITAVLSRKLQLDFKTSNGTFVVNGKVFDKESYLRTVCLIAAAHSSNVLGGFFGYSRDPKEESCLSYTQRSVMWSNASRILYEFSKEEVSGSDLVSGVISLFLQIDTHFS